MPRRKDWHHAVLPWCSAWRGWNPRTEHLQHWWTQLEWGWTACTRRRKACVGSSRMSWCLYLFKIWKVCGLHGIRPNRCLSWTRSQNLLLTLTLCHCRFYGKSCGSWCVLLSFTLQQAVLVASWVSWQHSCSNSVSITVLHHCWFMWQIPGSVCMHHCAHWCFMMMMMIILLFVSLSL